MFGNRKKFIFGLLVTLTAMFNQHSFAFDMPKEFSAISAKAPAKKTNWQRHSADISVNKPHHFEGVKSALLAQYSHWKGTRYQFGGTTRKGIDCSALMQHLFNDSLNKKLPRTTFMQIKRGKKVAKGDLKPGDLVFFKTEPNFRHVGVYIGDQQFIHVSKLRGVTISSLNNPYWVDRYETARSLHAMS